MQERYEAGDPEVDLLGEPSGKCDYYVLYSKSKPSPPTTLLVMLKPSWSLYQILGFTAFFFVDCLWELFFNEKDGTESLKAESQSLS